MSFLDVSQTVQSVNDNSNAAGILNRWWDFARRKVLRKAWWDFATITVPLALILDQSTLTSQAAFMYPGWRYIYQRPIDALRILAVSTQYGIRINPYTRTWWYDQSQAPQWGPYRPPFREALDTLSNPPKSAIDILTDQDAAWVVYTTDVLNVGLWTEEFQEAVAWNMAVPAAGPLSANQNAKKRAEEMALSSINSALAVGLNEQQPDPYPESPAITARM